MKQSPVNETITTVESFNTTALSTSFSSTPEPISTPIPSNSITDNSNFVPYNINDYINTDTPTSIDNSVEIQSAIDALGVDGGEITLQSDVYLSNTDLQVKSNIIISGVNPNITVHLDSKRINVAKNAVNVTVKDLVIDATNLGDRNALVVYANAQNITIQNIIIRDNIANKSSLYSLGNYVQIQNLTFLNVAKSYPIQISGSHTYIRNCRSSDPSSFALVVIGGGITDIHIEGNLAENRPLINGGYTQISSSDIWIQDNKLINFPKHTYGILIMGGTSGLIVAPFDKIFILNNQIKAGVGAYNAICIYGLSSNALVANNTVDQTLSGHNAIGIASGINVTVTQNTVFGCIEGTEGGIEVESNPVHNRLTGISENVNVTKNLVYGSQWGIYVRIMVPNHINWNENPLNSKNIIIEGNEIRNCSVGINLLHGDGIIVKDNYLLNNTKAFAIDQTKVLNYSFNGNLALFGYIP